jgi:O-antigen/teichoic acid export membrane protein
MSKNTLRKDYFWNTLGVFFQNGSTILLLVIITRINGIEASGLFSFASAVAIVLFAFGLWGGRLYQVSDIKREFDHRSYIVARVLLGMTMVIGAIAFSVVNGYDVYKSFVIILLVLFKAIESVADSVYAVMQVHGNLSNVGKSLFYKSVLGITLFLIIDLITGNLILSSVAIIAVNVVFFWLYDTYIAKKSADIKIKSVSVGKHVREAVSILRRTVTIFAVTFLATFSINIPRFFIDKFDNDQIGYFGIIAMPVTLIGLVMSFILQPNVVQLTKLYSRAQYDGFQSIVNKIIAATFAIGIIVALGAYIIGVPVLSAVFGLDFGSHKTELMVMVAGGIVTALVAVFINLLTIMRKFKAQFYTLLLTNVLLAVVSVFLVQLHGILAGVLLFMAISVIQAAVLAMAYHLILRTSRQGAKNMTKQRYNSKD